MIIDSVICGSNNFVDGVMIFKFNESKTSLLFSFTIFQNLNKFNLSEFTEVIFKVNFFCVIFDTPDKDLLHCGMSWQFSLE